MILGGRLGYVLFYKPGYYLSHPLEIFAIWQGGMSFHGGFLGVLAAMAFVAWRQRVNWWDLMDFVAPLVPIGLAAGRLGNFINGELWGRVTDVPWGMVFRGAGAAAAPSFAALPDGARGRRAVRAAVVVLVAAAAAHAGVGAVPASATARSASSASSRASRTPSWVCSRSACRMGQWLSLPMISRASGSSSGAGSRREVARASFHGVALRFRPLRAQPPSPHAIDIPRWFTESLLEMRDDVREAAAQGKRVMLYFGQDGCPYCTALMQTNFSQRAIADKTRRHFVAIALNLWGDREVAWAGRPAPEREGARPRIARAVHADAAVPRRARARSRCA